MGRHETRFGRGLRRTFERSEFRTLTELCGACGARYATVGGWMRGEVEPSWLRTLRAIKRATGATWDEILDGR